MYLRDKLVYEARIEMQLLDLTTGEPVPVWEEGGGKAWVSVTCVHKASAGGHGADAEFACKPLMEGELRVPPDTRLTVRMPTLALVDSDSAVSFAKALVKGCSLRALDGNSPPLAGELVLPKRKKAAAAPAAAT